VAEGAGGERVRRGRGRGRRMVVVGHCGRWRARGGRESARDGRESLRVVCKKVCIPRATVLAAHRRLSHHPTVCFCILGRVSINRGGRAAQPWSLGRWIKQEDPA
jgi:hypothetical protein